MYTVLNRRFLTFEEVVSFAWNTYMIDLLDDSKELSLADQLKACKELETMIKQDEEDL